MVLASNVPLTEIHHQHVHVFLTTSKPWLMENLFALLVTSNAKNVNLHHSTAKNVQVNTDKTHQNVTAQLVSLTHVAQITTYSHQEVTSMDTDQSPLEAPRNAKNKTVRNAQKNVLHAFPKPNVLNALMEELAHQSVTAQPINSKTPKENAKNVATNAKLAKVALNAAPTVLKDPTD
jgi:hypothetical protein